MRLLAGGVIAIVSWLVVAGQVPSHPRLRLADVVMGASMSQPFGCTSLELEPFDDLCPMHHKHTGVDLAAATGTEVHSATYGAAIVGLEPSGCGDFVVVSMDAHVRVLYCHLSAFRVRSGASVEPGQVIALVGSTGMSTGPHLHFQVDVDGVPVDPATWLAS
jgi:murein DD-endopeptidase MepM/ murein hydrolase activator NlpD